MPSRISYFNKTVFWSDQRRYWPLTAGYALFWVLLLPISRLSELHDRDLSAWNKQFETLNTAANAGYWAAFVFGILFAMAAFSYLTNPRATNGLHALPARRDTLYLTHCLAGLCAQLAALLLAVLLAAVALAVNGAFDARIVCLMLLSLALPTLFFYLFGVLCMVFTGQILAAPVFYGILNILVVGVELLLRDYAGSFLYGWSGDATPALTVLSPIVKLMQNGVQAATDYRRQVTESGAIIMKAESGRIFLRGLDWLLIYAAVGIVFAVLGLLVYRRRSSEETGSTVAVGWARPIFKYGVAFCAALALGRLFYFIIFSNFASTGANYALPGSLLCMAAAGLIGYFLSEMLLKKSFRVWRSGWKGAAVFIGILLLLGVGMSFDLTGFESYVPTIDRIGSANVSWYGGNGSGFSAASSDVETLRLVTDLHQAAVGDKARQVSARSGVSDEPGSSSGYLTIHYILKDGRFISRSYSNFTLYANELGDNRSPAATMTALYNAPSVALRRTLDGYGSYGDAYDAGAASQDLRFTGGYCSRSIWSEDGKYLGEDSRELTAAEVKTVYEAILRDVAAGRVNDSLFDYQPTSNGDLELYATYIDTTDYTSTRPQEEEDGRRTRVFSPRITERMTETVSVLRGMGIEIDF
ncbi:MAG: hypothetical protein J5449_12635 [Oscillospiraceae bacterium]|nr:hypothetical protein [Oscillospiraceae bacterium]